MPVDFKMSLGYEGGVTLDPLPPSLYEGKKLRKKTDIQEKCRTVNYIKAKYV